MCGIAGALGRPGPSESRLAQDVAGMAGTLQHRGPDDQGVWCDAQHGIALGHARLSIVDLSPAGHQPMVSHDQRWVLTFNGEIYNHDELWARLLGNSTPMRGTSDTEVFLEAIATWGPAKAIEQANGMFAFGLWDRLHQNLLLGRDRMGEKPLYYGTFSGTLLFASELKALRCHPAFVPRLDPDGLSLYLRYGHIPGAHTIYQEVFKLPPGHTLSIKVGSMAATPTAYWDLADVAAKGQADPWTGSDADAIATVATLVNDSVHLRMHADVPVGAFLSGGVDSSLVVALMGKTTSRKVKTFSIGFTDPSYDEAPYARAVAEHLGTDHTEFTVTPTEAQAVIPELANLYDEPFADSSQIPTCLLARLTRGQVTVSLSGDGGDELFAGYDRYRFHHRLQGALRGMPQWARPRVGELLMTRDAAWWQRRLGHVPGATRLAPNGRLGERVLRAAELMRTSGTSSYDTLLSVWPDPTLIAPGVKPPRHREPGDGFGQQRAAKGSALMRLHDQQHYLPDDILVKVDRATMAVGLEARVPLLDHRLVELSWRLPERLLLRGGVNKWILRQVLGRHVPLALTDRPKIGFGVPIGTWLQGPLNDWASDLLSPQRVSQQGLLDPAKVWATWAEHRDGQRDHSARLWTLLMFQSWLDRWDLA